MEKLIFSLVELGVRLRQLRLRAGLTQHELASRFETTGTSRGNTISRLENGLLPNPSLLLVVRYLRTCGARWNEIGDVIERVDRLTVDPARIEPSELGEADKLRVTRAVEDELDNYQSRLPWRRQAAPIPPECERTAAEKLRNYRVVANIVELAVSEVMKEADVTILQIPKYRAVGRQVLGLLWRLARTEMGRSELEDGTALPARVGERLEAAIREWEGMKLDVHLVREVQAAVIRQFRSLLEKNPGLFPLRGKLNPEGINRRPTPTNADEGRNQGI